MLCRYSFQKILKEVACRPQSTNATKYEVSKTFVNRNPRNLEKMTIGYKPDGYHLEKPGRRYWHKLELQPSQKSVTATIKHYSNGEVIRASTLEWAIKKHLYKTADTAAYINLGRVLAQRCLQFGIIEINSFITPSRPDGKVALFLKALEEGGVCLKEPPQYKPSFPSSKLRPEKPWEVTL